MNFWRGLQDSITSLFTISEPLHESNTRENPNYSISPISKLNPNCSITPNSRLNPKLSSKMEVGIDGSKVSNERIAAKLKGYCDLAKEEIAKAIVADESGLINDAILHYKAAQRVLAEGASTYVPSFISSSEQQKVNSNRQEISKWQDKVSERLQNLTARAGGTNIGKIATSHSQGSKNLSKATNIVKGVQPRRQVVTPRSSLLTGDRSEKATASRSTQNNSGSDAKLIEMINTAIVDNSPSIKWDDVAGLDKAKQALREMVIFPTLRRDLFTGIRRPARGLLLYGPPGNGKTMLAKAVASECNATFFNVTASTLTSKWVGEGEKLVRTLFMVAISRQPSVIFMDEIDSMMSTREANEHDASRRLKSEFLVQFDGVNSNPDDLVIVVGATNKPQEIDSAVLRRMVKRIYIPLPDENVRRLVLNKNMKGSDFSLSRNDFDRLVRETEGYSASDLRALCQEAALMPLRELDSDVLTVRSDKIRAVRYDDFKKALSVVRPSQRRSEWEELERWHEKFGSN